MIRGRKASFITMGDAEQAHGEASIARVEIPLFQRDYAQGRIGKQVEGIRDAFLDVLCAAACGTGTVGLDFVYGEIDADDSEEGEVLRPLDGQQRLTTLFLLHWYLASRSGHLGEGRSWERFTYATRQSAEMFCQSLVAHRWPGDDAPSVWIKDQPWYLFVWRHDPTIQSMLVVLDAIHQRLRDADATAAWARLTDAEEPAIWFLLLPLSGISGRQNEMRAQDLYIKMNSRGKPLTPFENFKAHFEKTIEWSKRASELTRKIDTDWSDMLWAHRGDDGLIDDEFLRYFEFVTEVCIWQDRAVDSRKLLSLSQRAVAIFGEDNPRREAHLDFLIEAFDSWVRNPPADTLSRLFSDGGDDEAGQLPLYFRNTGEANESLSLFEACCRSYGVVSGNTRSFSLGQTVMLYAVLLYLSRSQERMEEVTPDFIYRIRVLRNLVEASADEMRAERMPDILDDVHRVIVDGAIEDVASLNQAQKDDELLKAQFIAANPELADALHSLEDHELLRGSIAAFELEAECFRGRASAFGELMSRPELWTDLLAALLSVGEYQRQLTGARPFRFGTDSKNHDSAWRQLLTGAGREKLRQTRAVLCEFLDRVPAPSDSTLLEEAMRGITSEYLQLCEQQQRFDWRYYMVKYPSMRENGSHTYYAERPEGAEQLTMGYSLCMLVAGKKSLGSYHHDPYLLTICHQFGDWDAVDYQLSYGYEDRPRLLRLAASETGVRCVPAGWELEAPIVAPHSERFAELRGNLDMDEDNLIAVPQTEVDGQYVDTVDRIQMGAEILRRLVAAGL